MLHLTCEMVIEASLLNFRFPKAQTATISYATADSLPFAQVYNIAVPPMVMREINNNQEFTRQCEAAANHNAHVFWEDKCRQGANLPEVNEGALNTIHY